MNRAVIALAVIAAVALVTLNAGKGMSAGLGSGGDSGCSLDQGPSEGGIVPVIAECVRPVPADKLHKLLIDRERHDTYFYNLAESSVVAETDGVVTVGQIHQAWGITDREVLVEWRVERLDDGYRYRWCKSEDKSSGMKGVLADLRDAVDATPAAKRL